MSTHLWSAERNRTHQMELSETGWTRRAALGSTWIRWTKWRQACIMFFLTCSARSRAEAGGGQSANKGSAPREIRVKQVLAGWRFPETKGTSPQSARWLPRNHPRQDSVCGCKASTWPGVGMRMRMYINMSVSFLTRCGYVHVYVECPSWVWA